MEHPVLFGRSDSGKPFPLPPRGPAAPTRDLGDLSAFSISAAPELAAALALFDFLPDYLAREAAHSQAAFRDRCTAAGVPAEEVAQIRVGLEGLPGSGKSTTARFLPECLRSDYAGSDVGPGGYPPLEPDPNGGARVSLVSVEACSAFFTEKELRRNGQMVRNPAGFQVLDRTWVSQIVHAYALSQAVKLPETHLGRTIDTIESHVQTKQLYVPHWLVMFTIPDSVSYRKVVHRDGRFFGENMSERLSVEERSAFLDSRAEAYRRIGRCRGLPVKTLSYQAHPLEKLRAVLMAPASGVPQPAVFFAELRAALLPPPALARTA